MSEEREPEKGDSGKEIGEDMNQASEEHRFKPGESKKSRQAYEEEQSKKGESMEAQLSKKKSRSPSGIEKGKGLL